MCDGNDRERFSSVSRGYHNTNVGWENDPCQIVATYNCHSRFRYPRYLLQTPVLIHISHIVLVSLPARLFRYCSVFCAVAAISSPSIVLASSTAVAAPISLESLRELRREAMHRSRRIIFNNDGMDAVFKPRTEDSIEGILKLSTSALAGSHVDTIAYNTNIGGFGLFFHNTKVGE